MLRKVARSPFWTAASKFWIVERTMSSCDTFGVEPRVNSSVPRIATATKAAMTNSTATTQPQLRLVRGGFPGSVRGGMTCGETALGRPVRLFGRQLGLGLWRQQDLGNGLVLRIAHGFGLLGIVRLVGGFNRLVRR